MERLKEDPTFGIAQSKKAIAALWEARRAQLGAGHPVRVVAPRPDHREVESELIKAGFDVQKLERLQQQRATELRRLVTKQKADVAEHSGAGRTALYGQMAEWRKRAELLPGLMSQTFVTLDTPFIISTTASPGILQQSSVVAAYNNTAGLLYETRAATDQAGLGYYFLWQNPSDRHVVINVDGYIVLDGHVSVMRLGGLFPGSRNSHLTLDVQLNMYQGWPEPANPVALGGETWVRALDLGVYGGGFFDDGETKGAPVFRGYDLRASLVIVPPGETTVFELALSIGASNEDGQVDVDFYTDPWRVICPMVLVAIV